MERYRRSSPGSPQRSSGWHWDRCCRSGMAALARNPRSPSRESAQRRILMPPAAPRHLWMKGAVFALLACNTAIYVASGTISETLDSAAWLTLLVLFELETDFGERIGQGWAAVAIRSARFAAAAAVVAAAIGYAREKEWLDAANSGLWIAIVVLLEFQVRYTRAASRHRVGFTPQRRCSTPGWACWSWP